MKPFKFLLTWAFTALAFVANAQPWTYDFGTGTGTANNTNAGTGSTTFFSGTPAGGGTYRVRIGSGGGSLTLVNPGSTLGSGTEAVLTATTGTSSNKFTVYGWSSPSTAAYAKFDMRTASSGTGQIIIHFGSGAAGTIYQDNSASTNYTASLATIRITYAAGAISAIERRGATPSAAFYAIASSGIAAATDQNIELYGNNASSGTTYFRSGTSYSLSAQSWDLWVAGTKVSPSGGWGTAGTLAANVTLAGIGFFGESSTANAASVILDNLEYSNALPACTAPSTQASNITFSAVSTGTLDLSFTGGNGSGRIILMNNTNSFTAPSNGSNPTANPVWAGSGQQVIYNGTGVGPITISGLAQSTTYHFRVYEYCGNYAYSTVSAEGNPNSQSTAAGPSITSSLLTPFGSQCTGATYGPNSFTLNLENLVAGDITISSTLTQYQFATSSGGTYSNPLIISQGGGNSAPNVFVQYTPNTAAAHNGNISVSGGGASSVNVSVSGSGISPAIPTIGAASSANIAATTADLSATVSLVNCSDVTFRGIEWSTTNNFTNGTGTIVSETGSFGTGTFTMFPTGLPGNTTIYWKAFAENATGIAYTAQQSFTTLQEFLSIGDISIIGCNSVSGAPADEIAFVNWVPIKRNMIIKFTDNGFLSNAASTATNNARGGEGFAIWRNNTASDIAAGTVIRILGTTTNFGTVVSNTITGLSTADQIFAYQGASTTGANPDWATNTNPTTFTGTILYGVNTGTGGFLTTGAPTSNQSYLPSELNVENGNLVFTTAITAAEYSATRNALGTIAAYRPLVNSTSNWTVSPTNITLNTTVFTVNPNVATQIAVTEINGGVNPSANTPFTVSIELRDANGDPAPAAINTNFSVTVFTGSGAVSGTTTATLLAGSGTLDITGVIYNTAQSGVVLRVSRTSGQTLTAGNSAAFTVEEAASLLAYPNFENFAYTNNQLPTFRVEARRSNGDVDVNYTGNITLAMTGGTGALLGTLTKTAVAGVALFNDIIYDTEGVKVVEATATGLTTANSGNVTVSTPSLVEVVLPQFIQGAQPTNSNRIPFAYRVTLNGLKPLSTFRFVNVMVLATDAPTSFGAGNAIYVSPSGFTQSGSGVSLSTAGQFGTLTTDVNGSFTGWFVTEPTGNATRFNPGADIFPRIILNNGAGGSQALVRLTTQNSVRVLQLGALSTQGTALRGVSNGTPRNFVFTYNNTEGTGRPISGSYIESDGFANTASYASFYVDNVNGIAGAYGMLIPNNLSAGIRRIETRDLTTGELGGCASTDADGVWPSGANTVNPTGGATTAIVISTSDAPLAPSPEVCNNFIDDDCDGLIDEACPGNFTHDVPGGAINVQFSVNITYPNCFPITGNNTNANNSAESAAFDGPDSWYRFTAQSSAVSISMNSTTMDDAIALYSRSGLVYTLLASENASSGLSDGERLNYGGLTPGQTYFVSFGAASAAAGGTFTFCIQHLMQSGCASVEPASGYSLCDAFRAIYRGAPSQGVSYAFEFTGIGGGASGVSSIAGTNGLVTLSNPALGLRWGGEYNVSVDVNYALTNTASEPELIVVEGTSPNTNCLGVSIRQHPLLEVRSTQRCPASLLRTNFLIGDRIGVTTPICGAITYSYELTQVTTCDNSTVISVSPSVFTTAASAPYLPLGVLPALTNPGAWDVRIRPNFAYGEGTYGPVQRIRVNGTAASMEQTEEGIAQERSVTMDAESLLIYPNPSSGDFVNILLSDLQKGQLQLRVLDAAGRALTTRAYAVEESFGTTLVFDERLSAGVYMIEMSNAGRVQMQRLIVE